jgi:hypothetical protein
MMTCKHEIPLPYEFQFEAYDLNEQGKGMREYDNWVPRDFRMRLGYFIPHVNDPPWEECSLRTCGLEICTEEIWMINKPLDLLEALTEQLVFSGPPANDPERFLLKLKEVFNLLDFSRRKKEGIRWDIAYQEDREGFLALLDECLRYSFPRSSIFFTTYIDLLKEDVVRTLVRGLCALVWSRYRTFYIAVPITDVPELIDNTLKLYYERKNENESTN